MPYILDASVILTSYLDQDGKPHVAKRLKKIMSDAGTGTISIQSPDLLSLEVANGLRFGLKDSEKAQKSLEEFFQLPIDLYSFSSDQVREILKFSYQTGTTVYDMSYHFLAFLLDGTFLTCDAAYFKKGSQLNHIELIE